MKKVLSLALTIAVICMLMVSCATFDKALDMITGNTVDKSGLWENATYHRDMELGEGAKTIQVEVKALENSVTFTIHTDADILGDALLENDLIAGESGAYGLYVKTVNGIVADYDVDASYWSFYKGGEMMMTGVDGEYISGGEHYEIIYVG